MKIHSDILTAHDIAVAVPSPVMGDVVQVGSWSRSRGFIVSLYVPRESKTELHRYATNSGSYGAGSELAATWDEWGILIDRLFAIDPDAIIGTYTSKYEFVIVTRSTSYYYRSYHKPESIGAKTHTAPWLASVVV